jgi:hypothetical protein
MRIIIRLIVLALLSSGTAFARQAALDTAAIASALGREGRLQGDVYRVAFPRTDLTVKVGDVTVKPGLALGGWMAFRKAGADAVAHGDLVLLEGEINPEISKLQQGGIEITAVHNHLINESPHVMYVHFWGKGAEAKLAAALKDALSSTRTPTQPPPAPAAGDPGFDADLFQKTLGRTGTVAGGVLAITVPRPETISMMGVELPPTMGMATAINVQSAGSGKVAATGDFVMTGDEVNVVARVLRQHDIAIAALHNHMIHGTPELYFMHFWAVGDAATVASGLRAALDGVKTK